MKHVFAFTLLTWLGLALLTAGTPALSANSGAGDQQAEEADDPSKGSKDVDRMVPYPADKVHEAAKLAMATYGCDVKKEKKDALECTRSRRVGVFVGSGGEKVTVRLKEVGKETQVVVKTGKGFVGRLVKKNWSTPIFNEMLKNLSS